MSDPATSSPSRAWRWLWAAGAVLLVAGAGFVTWRLDRSRHSDAARPTTAPATRPVLADGHDYYFHVKLIELTEQMPGGKKWDRADDSGPDIQFSLTWRKNVIWTAIEKPNTLIGSWDLMKVDLRQMVMSGGQADLEGLVNAPLVHYAPGEKVTLKVWDEDPVGSDDAGTVVINLEDLQPGENTLAPAGDKAKSIKRIVLTVVDRRTSLPDLMTVISNR
jgi:hypothetical protein